MKQPMRHWLWRHALALPICVALLSALAACTTQRAIQEGEALIEQGRADEGLRTLEQAVQAAPRSAEARAAWLRQRDRVAQSLMGRAQRERGEGRLDAAESTLRQLLALEPNHAPAQAAIREMANERRWIERVREAEDLLARKQLDAARERLRPVLLENPRYHAARDLARRIDSLAERPEAAEPTLGAGYRKPVSIEFRDAPLRTVFEILARTSGLNFLFDKDVRSDQKTSIFLRNSTVEAAVNMLLLTNQLEQRVIDANTTLIYPASPNKLREYQPLSVRTFYLAHAEAKVVAATIRAITKSRDVVVDDKLNLLILRDSPAAIRIAERLVALHDVPEPEVMLEVEVLEIKRTRLLDLGIRWPDQLSLSPLASTTGGTITLQDLRGLNSSRIGATLGSTTLNARNQETDANILANPRIRTRNREKARVHIGERVPNITTTLTSTGFATDSVAYVDVGLRLDVEPIVYPDGEVAIRIALEVSNLIGQIQTKSGSVAYQIGTRSAQTVLRLNDGENQVLAGLISDEDRRTAYKVPALGDLPLAGRLFGTQADDTSKTEIVLSITPRVVRNIPRPVANLSEFAAGTEASIGARGVGAGGSPASTGASPAAGPGAAAGGAGPAGPAPLGAPSPSGTPDAAVRPEGTTGAQATGAATGRAALALSWLAPRQVRVGDTVTVQLMARGEGPIADVPLALGYDPGILQLVSVSEGEFLRQAGGSSQFAARTDPPGQVAIAATRTGGAVSGSGVLARISFRALAPSTGTAITASPGPVMLAGGAGGIAPEAPQPINLTVAAP
ncbi:MAG: general secretion pathway protein GspD [Rubrivivax sp.]|nr:general secretion pathway protein GspD [Rubrivivax sp.]